MPSKPPEPKQLELLDPKRDPTMESVLGAEQMINDILNAVAITFMTPLRERGEGFYDAKRIAKKLFGSFINTPNSHAKEKWIDFFVSQAKARGFNLSEKTLASLGGRLKAIQRKREISYLFRVRAQFKFLLAENSKGRVTLSKKTVEKIRELLYDLTFRHI